ncbi:sulfatase [Acetobacter cibinongensis]|uniref:Capsule polysaccharide biosynthesis protein n=1 Tax=Acetobacter cibinongensis TaxID=146475 RepID=A0A0D6N288_9PROT|nr:LTA synthase family protein [Acetobacter cibinongensis]GAN59815.1 capsule polysaccharide biosynthesis protein [Acetobacter cibinongensis]GEL59338.1 sulfatase [Acetobacter cibinongensis]
MFLREPLFSLLGLLLCSLFLETLVRPKSIKIPQPVGLATHSLLVTDVYGIILLVSGSSLFAAILTFCLTLTLVIASNLKWSVLDEPLVFSDLRFIKDLLRHPKFYIFAIPCSIRWGVGIALVFIGAGYGATLQLSCPISVRFFALSLIAGCTCTLALLPATRWAPLPALKADLTRFGLLGCLFIYWRCWQKQTLSEKPYPENTQEVDTIFDLIIVVQCESFTDPKTLNLPSTMGVASMPNLAHARSVACQYGSLEISNFGAYTIRTEYGVLFGRSEEQLRFQKFDPYMTAEHDAALSLPYKLGQAGYHSVFLHPYTLDFANRRNLMTKIGFTTVLGSEAFPHTPTPDMPYVPDETLATKLLTLSRNSEKPLFLYAVTIENHGPWQEQNKPLETYLKHLENSDHMIGQLIRGLTAENRSALLVFFGDHRPSIAPDLQPTPDRGTPYFVIPFIKGKKVNRKPNYKNLVPAELHHIIVNLSLKTKP